jgi:nucleoid DNA-binding protein
VLLHEASAANADNRMLPRNMYLFPLESTIWAKSAQLVRACRVNSRLCRVIAVDAPIVSTGADSNVAIDGAAEMALCSRPSNGEQTMAKSTTKKNKPISKSEILKAVADAIGEEISPKHVKQVVEALVDVGHNELKKLGMFVLPGFAKFVVVKKPARPAREGINPFTKEKQKFAAKPASKGVRARPVKAIKDAVG